MIIAMSATHSSAFNDDEIVRRRWEFFQDL